MMTRFKWPILSAVVSLLMTAGVVFAQNLPRSPFDWIIAKRLTVSGVTLLTDDVTTGADVTVGNDLTVANDAVVAADLAVSGNVTISDYLSFAPQAVITVTDGITIAPTGGLQYLTSAAATGTRLILTTTTDAGTVLILRNIGSNTITLTDTAPLILGGNAALGANDTLVLVNTGTSWVQLSKTDN